MATSELNIGHLSHLPPIQTGSRTTSHHILRDMLSGIAQGWEAFRRWQALEAMSDQQLARIGTTRRDTARFAVFGDGASGTR